MTWSTRTGPPCHGRYGDAVPDLVIRRYEDADEEVVLPLLAASLGKTVDDRYRALFRWKHLENPFGRSFMWVGEMGGRVVGFRAFLRWRFSDPDGHAVEAVRAVDTATHPDAQGLGVFRTLTLHGLDEMRPAGIQLVFNTPNDQSRPGYLKMGWHVDGRVPVQVRPRGIAALWRMARSRTPAEAASLAVDLGDPVADHVDLLQDRPRETTAGALCTDRSPEFLRWRYAGPGVSSRAIPVASGAVVLRFRRRGSSIECTVGDVLGSPGRRVAGAAVRAAMRAAGADFAIAATRSPVGGMVPLRGLGPIQTRREVAEGASRLPLALTLGDVELF